MSENNESKEPLNKNNKVPKLRFKNFKEKWISTKIGDSFSVGMCKRIFANQTSEVGEVPFYKIGTLGGIPDAYISKKLFDEYKQNYRFPKTGETLISCSGTIGRCIIYDGKDAYFQDSNIVWLVNDQTKIINEFLFYLISRYDWNFLNVSTIKRLFAKDLNNLKLYYPKDQREQKSISNFISILTSKIKNIENKIYILKKYKEGIEKYAYKFVENEGVSIKFSDLFDNLIEKNNHNFQQYTIGKNGIKKIDEINYDISNHKIFKKFNVIVGIGIDEIGINKDLDYGSVSPIYDVYSIKNLKYFDSVYVTLKEQLWKKRKFITRKSTRREFEVDKYELKKTVLIVVDNKDFTNVYQSITNIKKLIEILSFSFNILKILKTYMLRNMFI